MQLLNVYDLQSLPENIIGVQYYVNFSIGEYIKFGYVLETAFYYSISSTLFYFNIEELISNILQSERFILIY